MSTKPAVVWQSALDDAITALAWSPDGQRLAAASIGGSVLVAPRDGAAPKHCSGHAGGTLSLVWCRDGHAVVTGGQDGAVRWWTPAGEVLAAAEGGSTWVEHLAAGTDGMVASAAGRRVRWWDGTGTLQREWSERRSTVAGLHWCAKRGRFAASHYQGVSLVDPQGDDDDELAAGGSFLTVIGNPTDTWLATSTQDKAVHLWRLADRHDCEMSGFPNKIAALAWHARGLLLATAGGATVELWDCSDPGPMGRKPAQLRNPEQAAMVQVLAFRPPRTTDLVIGDRDGQVQCWTLSGHATRHDTWWSAPAPITAVAWNVSGDHLAIGDRHGHVVVLRVA